MDSTITSKQTIPILGPTVVGIMLSMLLFGVFVTQTYVYYQNFPKDRTWIKSMVMIMLLLDFVNAFLLGAALFEMSVIRFGQAVDLIELPRVFDIAFCLSIFIDLQSQAFFAYRLWMISGRNWMPCVCAVLAVTKAVSGFVASYNLMLTGDVAIFMAHWTWPVNLTLGCATACDVFTAISLSIILWSKREHGFSSTAAVLDKLVKWTCQTGILISISTLSTNVCFITMKQNFVWVGLHLMLPRIYSNSVLACLNGRSVLKSMGRSDVLTYHDMAAFKGQSGSGRELAFKHSSTPKSPLVHTETTVTLDDLDDYSRRSRLGNKTSSVGHAV